MSDFETGFVLGSLCGLVAMYLVVMIADAFGERELPEDDDYE